MCVQTTWYAHMFRTQGGDFGFPYEQKQSKVEEAKSKARNLFFNNNWDKQIHNLSWLVEKFWPVHGWSDADLAALKAREEPKVGILYFTDNELPLKLAKRVQYRIRTIAEEGGYELVSSSRKPMDKMGKNVVVDEPRGYLTMFKQILKGLEAMESDIVFFAEHDVLYPKEHFTFRPPDMNTVYYDQNWWKVHPDGKAFHWDADQVSGLCASRDFLIKYYTARVRDFDENGFDRRFEPMSRSGSKSWKASVPHVDVRHGGNLTREKRSPKDFRDKSTCINWQESTVHDIDGWPFLGDILSL